MSGLRSLPDVAQYPSITVAQGLPTDKRIERLVEPLVMTACALRSVGKRGNNRYFVVGALFALYIFHADKLARYIESFFNRLNEKTKIQEAQKVRATSGLIIHTMGKIAEAFIYLIF